MCNLAALACILFELWSIKVTHFLTILCVTLWAPQPPAPQPPAPPGTYLYILYCNFLIIHHNDLGLVLFQSRDIKLQIGTKVNVLGIVEVLKKLSNTLQKVSHETTPPYLRDQFTTCDLMPKGLQSRRGQLIHKFLLSCMIESLKATALVSRVQLQPITRQFVRH